MLKLLVLIQDVLYFSMTTSTELYSKLDVTIAEIENETKRKDPARQ